MLKTKIDLLESSLSQIVQDAVRAAGAKAALPQWDPAAFAGKNNNNGIPAL